MRRCDAPEWRLDGGMADEQALDLPPEPIEIAAGRLQLRPWEHRLAPELLTALADPEYLRWVPNRSPATLDRAGAWITARDAEWRAGTRLSFAVQDATSAALLGSVSLGYFEAWPRCAEVGYWTSPAARRLGVATEALGVLCRWAFGALGANRLELHHATENPASCRIALRCGFSVEGVARSALPRPRGGWYDMERHGRLRSDPPPAG
jgi:RimJ/RimL family protein N-acetyltransferase